MFTFSFLPLPPAFFAFLPAQPKSIELVFSVHVTVSASFHKAPLSVSLFFSCYYPSIALACMDNGFNM